MTIGTDPTFPKEGDEELEESVIEAEVRAGTGADMPEEPSVAREDSGQRPQSGKESGKREQRFDEALNPEDIERARATLKSWRGGALGLLDEGERAQLNFSLNSPKGSPRGQRIAVERLWQIRSLAQSVLDARDDFVQHWDKLDPDVRDALRSLVVPDWTPQEDNPEAYYIDEAQLPLQGDRRWNALASKGLKQIARFKQAERVGGSAARSYMSPHEVVRRQAERAARDAKRAEKKEKDRRDAVLKKGSGGGPTQGKGGQGKKGKRR